jgi:hypothetical protein
VLNHGWGGWRASGEEEAGGQDLGRVEDRTWQPETGAAKQAVKKGGWFFDLKLVVDST